MRELPILTNCGVSSFSNSALFKLRERRFSVRIRVIFSCSEREMTQLHILTRLDAEQHLRYEPSERLCQALTELRGKLRQLRFESGSNFAIVHRGTPPWWFGFLVKTLLPRISSPPTSQSRQATDLSMVRLSSFRFWGNSWTRLSLRISPSAESTQNLPAYSICLGLIASRLFLAANLKGFVTQRQRLWKPFTCKQGLRQQRETIRALHQTPHRRLVVQTLTHLGDPFGQPAQVGQRRSPNHPPPLQNLRQAVCAAQVHCRFQVAARLGMIAPCVPNPTHPERCIRQARWMSQLLREVNRCDRLFNGLVKEAHPRQYSRQHTQRGDAGVQYVQGTPELADRRKRQSPFESFTGINQVPHEGKSGSVGVEGLHDRSRVVQRVGHLPHLPRHFQCADEFAGVYHAGMDSPEYSHQTAGFVQSEAKLARPPVSLFHLRRRIAAGSHLRHSEDEGKFQFPGIALPRLRKRKQGAQAALAENNSLGVGENGGRMTGGAQKMLRSPFAVPAALEEQRNFGCHPRSRIAPEADQ